MATNETYHEGRPHIRQAGDTIAAICPYGHVLYTIPARDWAGSHMEANAGDPNWTEKCYGTVARRDSAARAGGEGVARGE